jgi:DNA repair protein RadC
MQTSKYRIQDLPLSSRPREKLQAKGRANLTDSELLAILLGSGSVNQNVLKLSEKLLKQYPLAKISEINLASLTRISGIGKSKASRILAALELGERVYSPQSINKVLVRTTEDAVAQLKSIAAKKQEYLEVLYLNARHELLLQETIGIGSLNSMVITPKEVFSPAFHTPCAAIIVAHNHPSGDPDPSDDDIKFTQRIHEAGEVLGIPLIDHLIIAKSNYFSFKENNVGK